MKELDVIEAFAELECVKVELVDPDFDSMFYATLGKSKRMEEYNPITDLALNCAARDKYKVEIDYDNNSAFIWNESQWSSVPIMDDDIPRAVIECILKSEGSWK